MLQMDAPKGLRISDIKLGTGLVAEKGLWVVVRYDCYLPQGDKCNVGSSFIKVGGDRNTFPALTHGVQGMAVGGIRQIKVRPSLTYYERERNAEIPVTAALRYEIELLSVWDSSGAHRL
jgi:FKBP-type peptidyl-prolyl cis-trans isomerase